MKTKSKIARSIETYKSKNVFLFMFILLSLNITVSIAATYYVSPAGNDSNSGTQAAPFKTIQKAVSTALAGDKIIVKPGTYGAVTINKSGTSSNPIMLMAEFPAISASPANLSRIKGSSQTGDGIRIKNYSHWIIDGFEISGFSSGISLDNVNNIRVRQNSFFENDGQGFTCWLGTDIFVNNNKFIDRGDAYPASSTAVMDYGVQIYWVTHSEITNNYFFGKFNHDISLKQNNSDTYIACNVFEGCMYQCIELGQNPDNTAEGDKTSKDATVENNTFRDAVDSITGGYYRASMGVFISNINNATVRYNFFENFYNYPILVGYELFDGDHRLGTPVGGNTLVYGNTIVNPSTASGAARMGAYVDTRQTNPFVKLYNNTFAGSYNSCTGQNSGTNLDGKNNLCKPASSNFAGPISIFDPNTKPGPIPIFTPDWTRAKTYALVSGSQYIDAGTNAGLPYTGAQPDVGSNEFIPMATTGCNPITTAIEDASDKEITEKPIVIYPNPFHNSFNIIIPQKTAFENTMVKIYDVCGKEVKEVLIRDYKTSVERGELKSGIYFYSIISNNEKIAAGKLIILD